MITVFMIFAITVALLLCLTTKSQWVPGLHLINLMCNILSVDLHLSDESMILSTGFELIKQNRFAKIYKCNEEKSLPKIFLGFVNHFMKNGKCSNLFSVSITKWSNALKQFVNKLLTNCLSVFDHFVGLALKVLTKFCKLIWLSFVY